MSNRLSVLMAMVLGGTVLALPTAVFAGGYVGIGIGASRNESSLQQLNLVPDLLTDVDAIGSDPGFGSTDVGVNATLGWMFTKNFGVEMGYTDFGEAVQNYELPEACNVLGCQSREWTAQMSTSGIQAFLVGSTPIGASLDAYLKLGYIWWEADYKGFERNVIFTPGPPIAQRNLSVNDSDSGTDLAAAMGLNLKTDSPISVRVELSYYDIDTTDLIWVAQLMGIYTF